ncbi:MAG: hypothetical protein KA020_04205 [Planctomycetes bacterium]|nr:hypothetical protein [Planctomycetota bacterium]
MNTTELEPNYREEALQLLDAFATRILPGVVRRITAWRKLPFCERTDLLLELRQELAVDCLQSPALLVGLTPTERNGRWLRLAERWVYRNRTPTSATPAPDPQEQPAPPVGEPAPKNPLPQDVFVRLVNGRCNMAASAARTGRTIHKLRAELEDLATEHTDDDPRLAFWRERLGEALTGLAADLLRDRGAVHLLPRERRRPDPRSRLRRLRRLRAHFQVRPATLEVRRVLAKWIRRPRLDARSPRTLLEQATRLCPRQPTAWLWLFEACLVAWDLGAAAHALRRGRQVANLPRGSVVLARARLLEARAHEAAALALLQRAQRRWPSEGRLRLAAAAILGAQSRAGAPGLPFQRPVGVTATLLPETLASGNSSARSTAASSRSAAGSARTALQAGRPITGSLSQRDSTRTMSSPPSQNTDARRSPGCSATGTQPDCSRKAASSARVTPPKRRPSTRLHTANASEGNGAPSSTGHGA